MILGVLAEVAEGGSLFDLFGEFVDQLVFERETLFTRTLHHETAFSIQRRLQFIGVQVIVLPIRVWERTRAA